MRRIIQQGRIVEVGQMTVQLLVTGQGEVEHLSQRRQDRCQSAWNRLASRRGGEDPGRGKSGCEPGEHDAVGDGYGVSCVHHPKLAGPLDQKIVGTHVSVEPTSRMKPLPERKEFVCQPGDRELPLGHRTARPDSKGKFCQCKATDILLGDECRIWASAGKAAGGRHWGIGDNEGERRGQRPGLVRRRTSYSRRMTSRAPSASARPYRTGWR